MIEWYKNCFARGWALGICASPCASSASGPAYYIRAWAADHGARHRPGGMVLTDYGARVARLK